MCYYFLIFAYFIRYITPTIVIAKTITFIIADTASPAFGNVLTLATVELLLVLLLLLELLILFEFVCIMSVLFFTSPVVFVFSDVDPPAVSVLFVVPPFVLFPFSEFFIF